MDTGLHLLTGAVSALSEAGPAAGTISTGCSVAPAESHTLLQKCLICTMKLTRLPNKRAILYGSACTAGALLLANDSARLHHQCDVKVQHYEAYAGAGCQRRLELFGHNCELVHVRTTLSISTLLTAHVINVCDACKDIVAVRADTCTIVSNHSRLLHDHTRAVQLHNEQTKYSLDISMPRKTRISALTVLSIMPM